MLKVFEVYNEEKPFHMRHVKADVAKCKHCGREIGYALVCDHVRRVRFVMKMDCDKCSLPMLVEYDSHPPTGKGKINPIEPPTNL